MSVFFEKHKNVGFIIMCEEWNSDNERKKNPWLWSLCQ